MEYTNSSLVVYTKLSPNHSGQRTHAIDRITPHCVVGQVSAESLGNIFAQSSKQASSNYGIDKDGRVGMYVEEKNRSWCSSSNANDQRAVTIECASDSTEPYAFKDVVYQKLITLCVDICRRNGKKKLLWLGDKETILNYSPKSDEMVLTAHRFFANKSCPGNWMYARMGDLAAKVTEQLSGTTVAVEPTETTVSTEDVGASETMLEKGDQGSVVEQMQTMLIACGFSCGDCGADGSFGNDTLQAVLSFQRIKGLEVDGIYGPKTEAALLEAYKSGYKAEAVAAAGSGITMYVPGFKASGSDERHGDGTVIHSETGHTLVIDGYDGGAPTKSLISYLKEHNYKDLHLMLSHPHYDHYKGLRVIMADSYFSIKTFFCYDPASIKHGIGNSANGRSVKEDYDNLNTCINEAKNRGAEIRYLDKGSYVTLGDIEFKVWRKQPTEFTEYDDGNAYAFTNDGSLCCYFPKLKFLTTGDGPTDLKEAIAYFGDKVYVLKVPHHGNSCSRSNAEAARNAGCTVAFETNVESNGPGTTGFTAYGSRRLIQQGVKVLMQDADIIMTASSGKLSVKQGSVLLTFAVPYVGTVATVKTVSAGLQATELKNLSNEDVIAKVGPLCTADQKKTGVLASLTMAQFILESGYGKTELAQGANNCFGMKKSLSGNTWSGSTWDGTSVYRKQTGEQNSDGSYVTITADFRKYSCMEDSIADHSAYLLGAKKGSALRYAGLKGCTDYEQAAKIIKNGGYATDLSYVSKLCSIIERWGLTKYEAKVVDTTQEQAATEITETVTVSVTADQAKYINSTGTHYISNSGSDENGSGRGGQAGDQTGKEWQLRSWYDRPWNVVLRYPDQKVALKIAQLGIDAALNKCIGYDMNQRDTYFAQLKKAGWEPSKITTACEADCSAGVCANVKAAGHLLGIAALQNHAGTYTGNMRSALTKAGFQALTASKYLNSGEYLLPGDILLNDAHHTATNITVGAKVKNSWNPGTAVITEDAATGASEPAPTKFFRVRKSWADKDSQIGAFTVFQNAINAVDANPGYAAFDDTGKQVYPTASFTPYLVRVRIPDLNYRKGPSTDYESWGYIKPGIYTMVDEQDGWGLLKAYAGKRNGWICLKYAAKI